MIASSGFSNIYIHMWTIWTKWAVYRVLGIVLPVLRYLQTVLVLQLQKMGLFRVNILSKYPLSLLTILISVFDILLLYRTVAILSRPMVYITVLMFHCFSFHVPYLFLLSCIMFYCFIVNISYMCSYFDNRFNL